MNTISIEVSLIGAKPYIGMIVGADEKYGYKLQFLKLRRVSRTYHLGTITAAGWYKLLPGSVVGVRRIKTGYVRVHENGEVAEIQQSDVGMNENVPSRTSADECETPEEVEKELLIKKLKEDGRVSYDRMQKNLSWQTSRSDEDIKAHPDPLAEIFGNEQNDPEEY